MPEEKPDQQKTSTGGESKPAEDSAKAKKQEEDAGDFITRHVLEKDSVFFEG